MRAGGGKGKGTSFERAVCKALSLWWTQGDDPPRDDVFWRSQSSGARATQRHSRGAKTQGQYGDVCSTDPCSGPLMNKLVVEVKAGYGGASLADLLDRKAGAKAQTWEAWVVKAVTDASNAGVPHWLLIVRRDRREAVALMPVSLVLSLSGVVFDVPYFTAAVLPKGLQSPLLVYATTFRNFLKAVSPGSLGKVS